MKHICALVGVAFLVMGCHCPGPSAYGALPSPKDVAAPTGRSLTLPFEAQDSDMNCEFSNRPCFEPSNI